MTTDSFIGHAIILSKAEGSIAMMLRELVRANNGKFVSQCHSVASVMTAIHRKEADLILIDHDDNYPASFALSQIIRDPIGIMTPTIVFCAANEPKEETAVERLGRPHTLAKPITPDAFKPAFRNLVARWNTSNYKSVRIAKNHLIDRNFESGLRTMLPLNNQAEFQPLIAPALAAFYSATKNPRTAEKVLLHALKNHPRDLGLILALADLYMHFSMPENARKLLVSAKLSFGNSPALIPDLIRCYVLLDQLDGALIVAGELWTKQLMNDEIAIAIAKMLFAEGRLDEISKYSRDQNLITHLIEAWNATSKSDGLGAAS